jgi:hypothetical protein
MIPVGWLLNDPIHDLWCLGHQRSQHVDLSLLVLRPSDNDFG